MTLPFRIAYILAPDQAIVNRVPEQAREEQPYIAGARIGPVPYHEFAESQSLVQLPH